MMVLLLSQFTQRSKLNEALIWITGNLFILACLYFSRSWKSGFSRTDRLNLAIAAMPIALVVYMAVLAWIAWSFGRMT